MEAGTVSPGSFSSGAMGFLLVIHDAHGLSEEQKGAVTAAMKRKRERERADGGSGLIPASRPLRLKTVEKGK